MHRSTLGLVFHLSIVLAVCESTARTRPPRLTLKMVQALAVDSQTPRTIERWKTRPSVERCMLHLSTYGLAAVAILRSS